MRAYAAAHFPWDEFIGVRWSDANAAFQSEYTGGASAHAYPVTIHGEIRGGGQSIDEAQVRLGSAMASVFPMMAVAANAAVADPFPIVAYGTDLTDIQPFLGYRNAKASEWFPPGLRLMDRDATLAFAMALLQLPSNGLLRRAIEFYARALGYWTPEQKLLAGEFLFIAAETLSRCIVEQRAAAKGITPNNLAQLHKVKYSVLFSRVLSEDVFAGDAPALDAMKLASDGFKHGFLAADQVRQLIEPVLERSMGNVRRAIVMTLALGAELEARLLAPDYDEPRGLVRDIWVVQGELSRSDPSKSASLLDGKGVNLAWDTAVPVATEMPDGQVFVTFPTQNIVIEGLPPNVQLRLDRIGLRAANVRHVPSVSTDTRVDGEEGGDVPRVAPS
jgi:hypothetical protein